jgi:hypothetical protein
MGPGVNATITILAILTTFSAKNIADFLEKNNVMTIAFLRTCSKSYNF